MAHDGEDCWLDIFCTAAVHRMSPSPPGRQLTLRAVVGFSRLDVGAGSVGVEQTCLVEELGGLQLGESPTWGYLGQLGKGRQREQRPFRKQ